MTSLLSLVDNHGQVYSQPGLPEAVADAVWLHPVVFSWCDGFGTRMTVVFTLPMTVGVVPGLTRGARWLYVAVEGYSTYGFKVVDEPLAADYIAEKLGRRDRVNPTWEALAELVGGVRMALARRLVHA